MSTIAKILCNLHNQAPMHFSTQGRIDAIKFHYAMRLIAQGC